MGREDLTSDGIDARTEPLLVVNVPPPEPVDVAAGPALDAVVQQLGAQRRGVLWIRGDAGTGRTTLVHRAVRAHAEESPEFLGALRLECWPGLRLEEALSKIAEFLFQIGIPEFDSCLRQRTSLSSKVHSLFQLLGGHDVIIWLDDFQHLEGHHPTSEQSVLSLFTAGCRELEAAGVGCRWIVVTERSGPEGVHPDELAADVIDLSPDSILDHAGLWQAWKELASRDPDGAAPIPELDELPTALRRPLAVKTLFSNWGALGSRSSWRKATSLGPLLREVRESLTPSARELLDLIAIYRRPMSRGTLQALAGRRQQKELATSGLEDLERAGLLRSTGPGDNRLQIHPALCDVSDRRSKAEDPDRWRENQRVVANHHLDVASKTRSVWDLYSSYVHLQRSKQFLEAYQVQKTFLEQFLTRGYMELAKAVLEQCLDSVKSPYREVVAGNLAIICKNEGNHDRAIELYKNSLLAFARRGDLANTARVYHQIGNTYFVQGKNDKALTNYNCCLEVAEQIRDTAVSLLARVQIANIQFARKEYDNALEVYKEAVEIADAADNKLMATALNLQIAQIHLNRNDFAEAEISLRTAEELARSTEDLRHLAKILQLQGLAAMKERNSDAAFERYRAAAAVAEEMGDQVEQISCSIQLGAVETKRQRFREALDHFLDGRDVALRLSSCDRESRKAESARKLLGSIDDRLGDLAATLGEEAFQRILSALGRADPRVEGEG